MLFRSLRNVYVDLSHSVVVVMKEAAMFSDINFERQQAAGFQLRLPQARQGARHGNKRARYWKLALYSVIGLTMNALTPAAANAADHIKVTREIVLEGSEAVEPEAIVQTHDGGYIVAGYSLRAWATRIDASGKAQWRFARTNAPNSTSYFHGAAVLPDDSTLLCGEVKEKTTDGRRGLPTFGLLVHIDKAGKVISEQLISPKDDKRYVPGSLRHCFPFDNGVGVLGGVAGAMPGIHPSYLLVRAPNYPPRATCCT